MYNSASERENSNLCDFCYEICGIIMIVRGIAQLVRACVLYTQCPWFESKYPDQANERANKISLLILF